MLSVLGPGGKLSCFCIKVSINKQSTLSTSAPHSCSLPHTIIMYNREKDHFLRLWSNGQWPNRWTVRNLCGLCKFVTPYLCHVQWPECDGSAWREDRKQQTLFVLLDHYYCCLPTLTIIKRFSENNSFPFSYLVFDFIFNCIKIIVWHSVRPQFTEW